jgi:hypothetical protein
MPNKKGPLKGGSFQSCLCSRFFNPPIFISCGTCFGKSCTPFRLTPWPCLQDSAHFSSILFSCEIFDEQIQELGCQLPSQETHLYMESPK